MGGDDYEVAWEDLHPGYRFVRALEVLVNKRRHLSKTEFTKTEVITDVVCTELGWMIPLRMAENYLRARTVESEDSAQEQDALTNLRIRAAEARLAEPTVFIDASNESDIHERFHLVLPFIVEQGKLRMPESPERYRLLYLSTLSHLANGIFEGNASRLFNEPQNVSDLVHSTALREIFGDGASQFSQYLNRHGPSIAGISTGFRVADDRIRRALTNSLSG